MSNSSSTSSVAIAKPTEKNLKLLVSTVAKHYGVSSGIVLGTERNGNAPATSMHVGVYLMRTTLGMTLDQIAERIQRSRTTVIRSIRQVERRSAASEGFSNTVSAVRVDVERAVGGQLGKVPPPPRGSRSARSTSPSDKPRHIATKAKKKRADVMASSKKRVATKVSKKKKPLTRRNTKNKS